MPKPASTEGSSTPKTLREAGLQSFQVVTMKRGELKKAPYNPRQLSEAAKRKLKAGLKRHGLVSPPTWNKRTGNIVGGHQRLGVLDGIMGTSDYDLEVAVIDVDEKQEKELNLLLNNTAAMGDWDMEGLGEMLKDSDIKLEGTGFDAADVFKMFGDDPLKSRALDTEELARKLNEAREVYAKITAGNKKKNEEEFYLVVVFRDNDEVQEFLEQTGLPKNRYQSADDLRHLMGMD
jgi:hypothetical protein